MSASTSKYHISKKGAVEPCTASIKACPLGGQHFESEEDAQDYLAFEAAAQAKSDFEREYKALQLEVVQAGTEVEMKDRWGTKKTVVLGSEWLVKNSTGEVIGGLEYRMMAHEKRRKDNPRALRRWYGPGWSYFIGSGDSAESKLTFQTSSKKAALEGMLRRHAERAAAG